MFLSVANLFIVIALISGLAFAIYSAIVARKIPILTDIFSVILSVAAGYSGLELIYNVLEGSKSLGGFSDQKLVIILGGISVFWVSFTTLFTLCKQVYSNKNFTEN